MYLVSFLKHGLTGVLSKHTFAIEKSKYLGSMKFGESIKNYPTKPYELNLKIAVSMTQILKILEYIAMMKNCHSINNNCSLGGERGRREEGEVKREGIESWLFFCTHQQLISFLLNFFQTLLFLLITHVSNLNQTLIFGILRLELINKEREVIEQSS